MSLGVEKCTVVVEKYTSGKFLLAIGRSRRVLKIALYAIWRGYYWLHAGKQSGKQSTAGNQPSHCAQCSAGVLILP